MPVFNVAPSPSVATKAGPIGNPKIHDGVDPSPRPTETAPSPIATIENRCQEWASMSPEYRVLIAQQFLGIIARLDPTPLFYSWDDAANYYLNNGIPGGQRHGYFHAASYSDGMRLANAISKRCGVFELGHDVQAAASPLYAPLAGIASFGPHASGAVTTASVLPWLGGAAIGSLLTYLACRRR